MNFIRKKTSTPLDELSKLYNDVCNRTIQNIAFEEKGEYKLAAQGWKSLHTNILYQMDIINKSFSNSNYSADEFNIREGIEQLDSKGLEHYERVRQLYFESEPELKPSLKSSYSNSSKSIPTLRTASPQGFLVRAQQEQQRQPRLLKTLRGEKLYKLSNTSSHSKPSEASKIAANIIYNTPSSSNSSRQTNWAPSKSLTSASPPKKSEDLIDLFDRSFDDDFLDNNAQTQRRNEALQQLEASALQSKLARSQSDQDLDLSHFDKLDISKSSTQQSSPARNSSSSIVTTRPPIPKTKSLISKAPIKKAPPSITNTRLPVKKESPTANSKNTLATVKPSTKPTSVPRITPKPKIAPPPPITTRPSKPAVRPSGTASRQPARTMKPHATPASVKPLNKKPVAKASTVKKPTTRTPSKTTNRARSESPNTEVKETETINSHSDEEGEVEEMQLSEKEVRSKMEDQIIEGIRGIDYTAAKQIFNEIVVRGDEVHWEDIAGLETAKNSLKETVVYPFLRPDLFSGLREPARGMLLFGPPGTGKTMLARAVATESKSTFFSISASSLTSKYLGESEKLVRALFLLAKELSPSIIFVDEIDSLLSSRNENGENESSRRIKNEFLIQWSELTHAAAGKDHGEDLQRVLVLAATNLPWAIDEAARRRFVRRQYIPLPETETRHAQIIKLLAHQKHTMGEKDQLKLVELTEGYSGSDITALAKDAAMGPLRSLGDKLLSTTREDIRPIELQDFVSSLKYIKPSVGKDNLKEFDEWALKFGSSGV